MVQLRAPVDMRIGSYRVQHQRRDSTSYTSLAVRRAALMTCQVSDLLSREHFKNNTDEEPTVEVATSAYSGDGCRIRRLRCEVQLTLVALTFLQVNVCLYW